MRVWRNLKASSPRSSERVGRRGHRSGSFALADQSNHLLDEERVALRLGDDARPVITRNRPLQGVYQLLAVLLGKRFEKERRGVALSAAPGGALIEKIRPREAKDEHRRITGPVRDMLDEVQQAGLGPVDVLEDGDQRLFPRERLEETAEGPERVLSGISALSRSKRTRNLLGDLPSVLLVFDDPAHSAHRRVSRGSLDDLEHRPKGDALAVRETPARHHGRFAGQDAFELLSQPRLADPGRAENRDEMT